MEATKNSEKGSATLVEMCLVFPLVLMVVFTLLYMGLYFLQSTVVNTYAQKAAVYVSRMTAIPGYDSLGSYAASNDFIINTTDYKDEINSAMDSDNYSLYRYWKKEMGLESATSKVESKLKTVLTNGSILGGKKFSCDIEIDNNFLFQSVTVTVAQTFDTPFFMTILGMKGTLKMETVAQATATSPSEFVRTVDFAYDMVDLLLQKLNLGSLDTVVTKIQGFRDKFGY